jgi:Glycosyl transferases group 1/Glycosyltransferase Family 4
MPCRSAIWPMRLAFLTSLVPTGRPDTGFEIANESLLDGLKAAGAEVTIFGFRRKTDTPDPTRQIVVLDEIDIETAKASRVSKLGWLAGSVLHGLPLSSAKLRRWSEAALIARIEAEGQFDGIIVNTAQMAGAYPGLLRHWPSILVAHNVEHLSARENADHAQGVTAFAYRREARLLERLERKAVASARHTLYLSDEDRDVLAPPGSSSSVLALLTRAQAENGHQEIAFDVGLIGTWTWRPNRVGLEWFLQVIVPQLPPDLVIGVAGRMPSDLVSPAANVRFLGLVPDATAFVRSCRMMALTSRIGTGVQLKTIELMQLGWPAVATASSLRGVSFWPSNFLTSDSPTTYAKAMSRLVRDIRDGASWRLDGEDFAIAQRAAMAVAIQAGLAALR